jgi:hypothetical protein
MTTPPISIITPCFDSEKFTREAARASVEMNVQNHLIVHLDTD